MIKILFALCLFLAGCSSDEDPTVASPVIEEPETPDALTPFGPPEIIALSQYQGAGVDGSAHNYIKLSWKKVQDAIGYKAYSSVSLDGPWVLVTTGSLGDYEGFVQRDGIYIGFGATFFFAVTAVDNDGKETERSPHKTVVYDGVD